MDLSRRSALQCLGAAAGAISSPLVWTKPSAGERIMVIDCHGHYTTAPRQLEAFRQNQIAGWKDASRAPASARLDISDEEIRESLQLQLKFQRERGTDLTIFSPRAAGVCGTAAPQRVLRYVRLPSAGDRAAAQSRARGQYFVRFRDGRRGARHRSGDRTLFRRYQALHRCGRLAGRGGEAQDFFGKCPQGVSARPRGGVARESPVSATRSRVEKSIIKSWSRAAIAARLRRPE